ncbi:MAG: YnfA family protein [Thermoplasmata archaeon]
MNETEVLRSVSLFVLAGFAEIGGGYLVWQWMRSDWSVAAVILGAMVLVAYGFILPFQPATFGRVYAAYGGVFIVMSVLWGWLIDHRSPDRFEVVGAAICLVGVGILMYWPR